jgi:glycosyltransferase involved in cell wall biosynthesis
MKVLLTNKFFYIKGGAEKYYFELDALLKAKGHQTVHFSMIDPKNRLSPHSRFFVSNVDYTTRSIRRMAKQSLQLLYSREAYAQFKKLLQVERPDIVHINNIYHQISPSIIDCACEVNIPVIMTLHDSKMVCASYAMWYRGRICEACKNGKYYFCAVKRCFKDAFIMSLLGTIEMYLHHRVLRLYEKVDAFISPSLFLKGKLNEMGFKRDIQHLSNFLDLAAYSPRQDWDERRVLYVGRLSRDKGVETLIDAFAGIKNLELHIVGDGPERQKLQCKIQSKRIGHIKLVGYMNQTDLMKYVRGSMFTVIPSMLYENNPFSVIEAFALGKPVVGSRIGGIPELIQHGRTGLLFPPGDVKALRAAVEWLSERPEVVRAYGHNARRYAEDHLNAQSHYDRLMAIYDSILS